MNARGVIDMSIENNEYLTDEDLQLFQTVVDIYKENESIRDTAFKTELSRSKVRKILITMGEMTSEITEKAVPMLKTGMTIKEVAVALGISTGTLSTYIPYDKRVQGREERSVDAVRSENYRARQSRAASTQVNKTENKAEELKGETMGITEGPKHIMVYHPELEEGLRVFKLHLELDTTGADMDTLKRWGKVDKGISRDIIVSPFMTLHALHYAIQKCFGWENSHLHHFEFPEEVVNRLTSQRFIDYCKYCGLYFRFPYGDDQQIINDLYWDDDYREGQSFKTWLKKKYNPPFRSESKYELYIASQHCAKSCLAMDKVSIVPSFAEFMNGNKRNRSVKLKNASLYDMDNYFEGTIGELIERASIQEYLRALIPFRPAGEDLKEAIEFASGIAKENESTVDADIEEFIKLEMELEQLVADYNSSDPIAKSRALTDVKGYDKRFNELVERSTDIMPPLAEQLVYKYDCGDGWEVKITMADEYRVKFKDSEAVGFTDKNGKLVDDQFKLIIGKVFLEHGPVCVAADGLPVMDDVGGIHGYCEFLKGIHGVENIGPYEDADESKEWARSMGWTGRMSRPDKML